MDGSISTVSIVTSYFSLVLVRSGLLLRQMKYCALGYFVENDLEDKNAANFLRILKKIFKL